MLFKINGFGGMPTKQQETMPVHDTQKAPAARRSVVQVHFPDNNQTLSYYNDQFDLQVGDPVYVDGKLEGLLGHVTKVSYNFKIKLSDYRKVIAVVNTQVHGQFYVTDSHFVSFDPTALPKEQIALWFKAPPKEDEEYISGNDGTSFRLDDLSGMHIDAAIAARGHQYFLENRVAYLCLNGTQGYAIVTGGDHYSVEFEYRDGEISRLICDCPCCCSCKHAFAAMLQLQKLMDDIQNNHCEEYTRTGCFAAIDKCTLFNFAFFHKHTGGFAL